METISVEDDDGSENWISISMKDDSFKIGLMQSNEETLLDFIGNFDENYFKNVMIIG